MSSTPLETGDKAPDFTMPASTGKNVSLSDFKGKKLVLYFYPKDDTPGCTTQACSFRDNMPDFSKLGVAVIGVSKDSLNKHEKFIAKHGLNFTLASDEEGEVCQKYGVWKEKSMFGKKYFGIERSTFLIDEQGKIQHIWRKVKVSGHIEEVLQQARQLKAAA